MSSQKKTVLVVDDEPDLVDTTCDLLESAGFNTIAAGSGEKAWEVFQANDGIALVLSDIRMTQGDGMWLLKKIKQSGKPLLGFIFMSAFSDYSRADLLAAGADELFSKPFDASALVKFLRSKSSK
jgi:two-component system cell cycle sensor histidine kinase/response regulator CckA